MRTKTFKADVEYPVLSNEDIVKLKLGSPRLFGMYEQAVQWIKYEGLSRKVVGEHVVYEIVYGLSTGVSLEEIEEGLDPGYLGESLHDYVIDALHDFFRRWR